MVVRSELQSHGAISSPKQLPRSFHHNSDIRLKPLFFWAIKQIFFTNSAFNLYKNINLTHILGWKKS